MRLKHFISLVAVQSCALALAFASANVIAQPVAAEARAGGKDSHTFGPVVVGAGQVSKRLPPPQATVDLYTKAGEVVKDPPAVTGPIVIFGNPSTGKTVSDGPLENDDGKGNVATAFGKMTGSIGEENQRGVHITKTKEGSVSAVAAPKDGFAKATSSVRDPVTFEREAPGGLAIQVGLSLGAGSSFAAQGSSFSSYLDDASTDLPGVGSLWTLAINLSGETGILGVAFSSNPLLGLSDASISNLVRNAFSFDGTQYSLLTDLSVFSAILPIPDNVSQFSFSDGSQWDAQASTIPEPSAVLLLAMGLIVGSRMVRRPRK